MFYPTITRNRLLYVGIALLSIFLIVFASGGGLFHTTGHWLSDWQHKSFQMLCHQDPSRSFWINGKPMAVCSRCYGIYAGLAGSWLMFPFLKDFYTVNRSFSKPLLPVVVVLNIVDVVGNLIGLWENTLLTRFSMGLLVGMGITFFLSSSFFSKITLVQKDSYGYPRATH